MHLILGLDYELFLGARPGTVERCLLEPTDMIAGVMEKHGLRCTLFVDATFLLQLQKLAGRYAKCAADLAIVEAQLRRLVKNGHDVQLHVHPHWEDCTFDGSNWFPKTVRYRLHDFDDAEVRRILHEGKALLANLAGCEIFAFRAGGWCLQPFPQIASALRDEGIWLDSTVFVGGQSEDRQRWYDFTSAPDRSCWRFGDDPNVEDQSGAFVEVPISSHRLGPLFFWGMALRKKLGGAKHRPFGDGGLMQADGGYYWHRLSQATCNAVSMDGAKADMLEKAFQGHVGKGAKIFNVIGHPKTLTRYALTRLDELLARHSDLKAATFRQLPELGLIPMPTR